MEERRRDDGRIDLLISGLESMPKDMGEVRAQINVKHTRAV